MISFYVIFNFLSYRNVERLLQQKELPTGIKIWVLRKGDSNGRDHCDHRGTSANYSTSGALSAEI